MIDNLNLRGTGMGDTGAKRLAEWIAEDPEELTYLNLADNGW
jgi:hypothetical protein